MGTAYGDVGRSRTSAARLFELKEFETIPAGLLVDLTTSNRLEEFFLALALAYNDLKGLIIFWMGLKSQLRLGDELTPAVAQWNGITVQFIRLSGAWLHEVFELIRAFPQEISGAAMLQVLSVLDAPSRKAWFDLVAEARGKGTGSWLAGHLCVLRNNLAFHYHQPRLLAQGYRAFFRDPNKPGHDAAYVSLGSNMAETRFYYADAAAQEAVARAAKLKATCDVDFATAAQSVSGFLTTVNKAIAAVLHAFIHSRRGDGASPAAGV